MPPSACDAATARADRAGQRTPRSEASTQLAQVDRAGLGLDARLAPTCDEVFERARRPAQRALGPQLAQERRRLDDTVRRGGREPHARQETLHAIQDFGTE